MEIKEALKNLGLGDKEALVYSALVELGETTAYKIAQKCGLKRPTVYVILEELRMKGLVLKIPNAKKQVFIPKDPQEFFEEAENRLFRSKSILPKLMAMARKGEGKPQVLYYEGIEGVKDVLNYKQAVEGMSGKEIVGFYAHTENTPKELLPLFDDWQKNMEEMSVSMRGVVPDHESLKAYRAEDEKSGRKMKIVPFNVYSSSISVDIGETFTRILSYKDLQGIIIENQNIADALRQIFEMVWAKY